ncbi:MAG: nucleotidyltransferase family protein [Bacillota bacterium]|nr:MAG: nucleotidyltransferase family protein [Bacillota bacterium]
MAHLERACGVNVMSQGTVGAVVLAAGLSTRLGWPKQLLPLGGHTVLEATVAAVLASRAEPVVLVVNRQVADALPALGRVAADSGGDRSRLSVIVNPHPEQGQSTSLRQGLRALLEGEPGIQGALVVLGDQPLLPPTLLDRIIQRFLEESPRPAAVRPVYRGRPGHPVLLARSLFPEVEELTGDQGARRLLERHRAAVVAVETDCVAVIQDLDTWSDYLTLCRQAGVQPAAGPWAPQAPGSEPGSGGSGTGMRYF